MMNSYPRPRLIAIDVDGTLVIGGELNTALVAWIEEARGDGYMVYLWSMRGPGYAKAIAAHYKVEHLFDLVIGKPGFIVDDMGWAWTRYTKVVEPICNVESEAKNAFIRSN